MSAWHYWFSDESEALHWESVSDVYMYSEARRIAQTVACKLYREKNTLVALVASSGLRTRLVQP